MDNFTINSILVVELGKSKANKTALAINIIIDTFKKVINIIVLADKKLEQKKFRWTAVSKTGAKKEGVREANNAAQVKAFLSKEGMSRIKVKVEVEKKSMFGNGAKKIVLQDIALFARQLSTMLKNGIALVTALEIVRDGVPNPAMKDLINDLKADISTGTTFTNALKKKPEHFDELFTSLVGAGEESGSLEDILDSIATYQEKTLGVQKKIKKAVSYPLTVLVIALGITVMLLVKVVPTFEKMFSSFGGVLPAPTQIVVNMSEFMQAHWLKIIVMIGVSIFVLKKIIAKNENLQRKIEYKVCDLPVFGNIIVKSSIARFARTLATTFRSGVPLIDGLESAAGATGNAKYKDVVLEILDEVSTGTTLSFAMENSNVFPKMIVQMVAIGEETGGMDAMLNKGAEYFEEEVDASVDAMTSMLEPLIMAFLGVVVGGTIIAMYLPMFKMGSVVN